MMELIKRRSIVERREIADGSEIANLADLPVHAVLRVDHSEEGSVLMAEWTRLEADEEVITRLATVYAGTPAEEQGDGAIKYAAG